MSWTDARIAELERLWGEGKSASEIAGLMGLTRNAIIGKAHRMGLDSRRDGMTRPWSPARLDHLASLAEAGWSSRQIAREMGVSSSTVCNQIRLIGARLVRSKPKDGVTVAAPPKPPRADRAPQIIARVARSQTDRGRNMKAAEPKRQSAPPDPPTPPDCAPVSLLAAGFGQCRFPVAVWSGPHAPFYCGAPAERDGATYCSWHARIARGAGTPSERRAHWSEGRAVA